MIALADLSTGILKHKETEARCSVAMRWSVRKSHRGSSLDNYGFMVAAIIVQQLSGLSVYATYSFAIERGHKRVFDDSLALARLALLVRKLKGFGHL